LAWIIDYTDEALRQLNKIDKPSAKRILDYMDQHVATQANPRNLGKALTGTKLGTYWRYRAGDYRVICDIQDGVLRVLVLGIGHRSKVYR